MTLEPEDKRQLRIVLFVVGGFLVGILFLFFIIATDV